MLILLLPFGWTISKYLIAMVIMEEFDFLIVEQWIIFESLTNSSVGCSIGFTLSFKTLNNHAIIIFATFKHIKSFSCNLDDQFLVPIFKFFLFIF